MAIESTVLDRVNVWLNGSYDNETKEKIKELLETNPAEITEAFYRTLEFGTGGLRGIMGVGTNRMNIYTVGMATQGLANYLKAQFPGTEIKVAVACDSRNNSELFARTTAEIFAANGFKVFLFDALRPTPELSFAIRHLGCQSGVVVTASHNPKQYNGYKAYWADGSQVIAPHDKNIIAEVEKITDVADVKWSGSEENITIIGEDVDKVYMEKIKSLSLSPELIASSADMKIVYTPIHGSGTELVPRALKEYGFKNITVVEEQRVPNGDFPTVKSPNPEETATLQMALDKAEEIGADLVMATDPDADRIGIAVRDNEGKLILLNGNQTAVLLTYYLLKRNKELGLLKGNEFIVKTIVTSALLVKMAESFDVEYYDVLTGFKFIAAVIAENEGKKRYIGGGEESYGYLIGDFVRDKDAVSASAMIAETAAWSASQGLSLYQLLLNIYQEFGLYREGLVSVVREGKAGQEEIKAIMTKYRAEPLEVLGSGKVIKIMDYLTSEATGVESGSKVAINLPKSDVLQYFTEDGTVVSMRPSGTEPKIKFYFGVRAELKSIDDYDNAEAEVLSKIEKIKSQLGV